MKLLTRFNIIYLLIIIALFIAGSAVFFWNIRSTFEEEAIEILYSEKKAVETFIQKNNTLPVNVIALSEIVAFDSVHLITQEKISDTLLYVATEDEMHPYHVLEFPVTLNEKKYTAKILSPDVESDDLMEAIAYSFAILALVLIVILFAASYFISGRIWKPFFDILHQLRSADIKREIHFVKQPSLITEFKELNEELEKLTLRVNDHFRNIKSFTENASHEMQTPLAIIKNKTELLLQNRNLTPEQQKNISEIHATASRMGRINQGLLLLAKIENNQFRTDDKTDFSSALKNKLLVFEDLLQLKNLQLVKYIEPGILLPIHPYLADILINNLLSNAVRHCKNNGTLKLQLDHHQFTVTNSGDEPIKNPDKIFDRFYKENNTSESSGLGLAIVKEILKNAGYEIRYQFTPEGHQFVVRF
ncbi:MAG: HAMP domain-containing sensor histidine kinase [Bacteroidia bacterium]